MKLAMGLVCLAALAGTVAVATGAGLKPGHSLYGELVKVDGRDLIVRVKQSNGVEKEITLATDDHTEFRVDGEVGTIDDLRPDMHVAIGTTGRAAPGVAKMLVKATSKRLVGKVARVEGRIIVVKALSAKDTTEWTVETNDRTKFLKDAGVQGQKEIKLEDIKEGMRVTVTPDSGLAKKIIVGGGSYIGPKPQK